MYEVNILIEESRKKEKQKIGIIIEGDDRKLLMEKIPETIIEAVKENKFKNPTAEYVLTKNGTYIDGEVDLKVKINRNGVTVKMGDLII